MLRASRAVSFDAKNCYVDGVMESWGGGDPGFFRVSVLRRDRTLKLWDLPSRQLTKTLDQDRDATALVAFAPGDPANGKTVISGGSQTINVWQ